MQGWQDAQRTLYRSYAITAKGAADARSLTDSEREKLQLVVKIKSGSSDQEADLTDVLKEAVLAASTPCIVLLRRCRKLGWHGESK